MPGWVYADGSKVIIHRGDTQASAKGHMVYYFVEYEHCMWILTCSGDDGMTEYRWRTGKKGAESAAERRLSDDLTKLFRIYFPTWDTVGNSKGGTDVNSLYISVSCPTCEIRTNGDLAGGRNYMSAFKVSVT